MYPFARLLTWLGIISLTFGILLGCAERRVHVSTASGKPGEATGHDGENAGLSGLKGLSGESVDESGLGGQATPAEPSPTVDTAQSTASEVMPPEEVQVVQNEATSDMRPQQSEEKTSKMDGLSPLTEGQHLQAQSGSSGEETPARTLGDSEASLPEIELEQIPATFQVANVEPSETGRQRLEEMKRQELATAAAELEDVFFQFDSWSLTPEGKQALERDMGFLHHDAAASLLIEGHADQRGTQAYNLILGKRRAGAIRDYLSEMGIDPQRLAVISYGKDKPFCLDPTEVCYQLNRRGHLLVQNPQ